FNFSISLPGGHTKAAGIRGTGRRMEKSEEAKVRKETVGVGGNGKGDEEGGAGERGGEGRVGRFGGEEKGGLTSSWKTCPTRAEPRGCVHQ
ncbi:unnamed protein product, partial [Closterium sp. NIES-54]